MNYLMYIVALVILIVILKILTFPIKLICKFIVNSILGGILLYFLAKFGIFMMLTWWSILLTGLLGVPGVIIAVILSMFIL